MIKPNIPPSKGIRHNLIPATLAILPLSISVVPWGILCGTLAIEAGLSNLQAQLMSLIVFAGAVQISGVAILGASGSWLSLINSSTMISVRHVLYSASYKEDIVMLPFRYRILFAFLLTDEMFAVAKTQQIKTGKFDYWYAVIAGFVFYIIWNLSTFIGIHAAHLLGNINELGFDFAIAATFIAMVVPMIKTRIMLVSVVISAIVALFFALLGFEQGLIIAALIGMVVGSLLTRMNA